MGSLQTRAMGVLCVEYGQLTFCGMTVVSTFYSSARGSASERELQSSSVWGVSVLLPCFTDPSFSVAMLCEPLIGRFYLRESSFGRFSSTSFREPSVGRFREEGNPPQRPLRCVRRCLPWPVVSCPRSSVGTEPHGPLLRPMPAFRRRRPGPAHSDAGEAVGHARGASRRVRFHAGAWERAPAKGGRPCSIRLEEGSPKSPPDCS